MRNDMTVRTATNENRQAAAEGQKNVRNRTAAHARHYGIKDSKASPDTAERIRTDVSARHFRRRRACRTP
ncbi:hypothetical protein C6T66_29515 [Burkholderia multivorans]|nr:hypothetical protein C6P86_26485 [Burkholderia multivorans]PRE86104.1 hypothetical protein C6Q00_13675 [Burkholderia multivorans]PRF38992.1 hypothetical protein C6Q08_00920 [Burkholderia multivorans]PRG15027.1 hypothetical protein C6Q21_00700 [Burkholderia multivorans]PRG23782.1 hypothetical protein C6T57_11190 [Burkholderia multivorans]